MQISGAYSYGLGFGSKRKKEEPVRYNIPIISDDLPRSVRIPVLVAGRDDDKIRENEWRRLLEGLGTQIKN